MTLQADQIPTQDTTIHAEGRAAEAAPPPPIPDTGNAAGDAGGGSQALDNGPGRSAPDPAAGETAEDRAFRLLEAGQSPDAIRTAARDNAPPSARTTQSPAGGPAAGGTSSGPPTGQPGAPSNQQQQVQQQAVPAEYGELDPKSFQALKRTGTLPAASDWADMPSLVRANLVKQANVVLRQRERDFQAQQQQRQQHAAASNAHPLTEGFGAAGNGNAGTQQPGTFDAGQASGPQTTPGTAGNGGAGQQGLGQQQATRNPQGNQAAAASSPSHAALQQLRDDFGDALATPISQIQQAVGQELSAKDQQIQHMGAQVQSMGRQMLEMRRDFAFRQMEPQFPQLKDPQVRQRVFTLAAHLVIARHSANEPAYTLEQGMEAAARAELFPNQQESAQRALATQARTSVRGTSERSSQSGVDRAARSLTREQREDQAFEQLQSGRTPDEVRAAMR